ncbi:MAG: NAD(P)/FAD-dependent oxidoreductase [Gammaproteobacteria bacterium]|jgi:3-phenylpropionate/trans-cinnamate dioxygenase ferredoxin reductase subunit
MEELVVIGGGQAAIQCVASLRKEGYSGSITLVGEENHLPYQRPPLSKGFLSGATESDRLYLKKIEFFQENSIQLNLGVTADRIDRDNCIVHLSDDKSIGYDKLVLATGSRVRKLKFPGSDLEGINYLRGIDDAESLKDGLLKSKNLVIVGAGYIGLEVAAVATEFDTKITVIEMADRVMNRTVDPIISDYYQELHSKNGVDFILNESLEKVDGDKAVEQVICSGGSSIQADILVIGAGVIPNIELAEESELNCDNGISVNEYGQTEDSKIFACGDCTNHPNEKLNRRLRLESVHNAMEQSKTVATSVMGNRTAYNQIPWFWSDQYDHKLQIVGLSGDHDEVLIRGNQEESKFMLFYLKGEELIAVDAVNNPKEFLICRKLVENKVKISSDDILNQSKNLNDLII